MNILTRKKRRGEVERKRLFSHDGFKRRKNGWIKNPTPKKKKRGLAEGEKKESSTVEKKRKKKGEGKKIFPLECKCCREKRKGGGGSFLLPF